MAIAQNHVINIQPGVSAPLVIHCSQGDTGTQINLTVVNGDEEFDCSSYACSVHGTRSDRANWGPFTCNVSGSTVSFSLTSDMTAVAGSCLAEVSIGTVGTANFALLVENATFENGVTYSNDVSVYQNILAAVQDGISNETAERVAAVENEKNERVAAVENEKNERVAAVENEKNERVASDNSLSSRISQNGARINNLVSNTGDSNSEIVDARVNVYGLAKSNLGEAVREQGYNALYGAALKYINFQKYYVKDGGEMVVNTVTNGSISITFSGMFGGVVYPVLVKPHTDYVIGCTVNIKSGNAYFDITNASQTEILADTDNFGSSGERELSFNSADNNTVVIRIGNGNEKTAEIEYSDAWIYRPGFAVLDDTLIKDGYPPNSKTVGEFITQYNTASYQYPFPINGWINYYENSLTYRNDDSGKWTLTDFIPIYPNTLIKYRNLSCYIDKTMKIAVAYIIFFDSNKDTIKVYNGIEGEKEDERVQIQYDTSGLIEAPSNASYVRFTAKKEEDVLVEIFTKQTTLFEKIHNSISSINNSINSINNKISTFAYKKKINIIGDSISQGIGAEITYDDSYAGILRKMFMIENNYKMNYGFEPFPTLSELSTVTKTMVNLTSYSGFSRKWNGTNCFGSDEYSSSTVGSKLIFSINGKFNYFKVSYKDGVSGSFSVKAGDILLATVKTTDGNIVPKMSEPIDISSYSEDQRYSIEAVDGSVTVSGVELGFDANYPVFNNYGRAGIDIPTVMGTLLSAEADCDILIYALGTNGSVDQGQIETLTNALKDNSADIIILDLCMKTTSKDNSSKTELLKQLANNIDATYISMYSIIPKNADGYSDQQYFISDKLHPSLLGHRCIAESVARTLNLSAKSKGIAASVFTKW